MFCPIPLSLVVLRHNLVFHWPNLHGPTSKLQGRAIKLIHGKHVDHFALSSIYKSWMKHFATRWPCKIKIGSLCLIVTLKQCFLTEVRPNPLCSTELSLGFGESLSISWHFQGRTQGAAGHLILGGKLNFGRRNDLFFGLHLILGGKLDVTLSVSRVRLRLPQSWYGSATWHGLRNTALKICPLPHSTISLSN